MRYRHLAVLAFVLLIPATLRAGGEPGFDDLNKSAGVASIASTGTSMALNHKLIQASNWRHYRSIGRNFGLLPSERMLVPLLGHPLRYVVATGILGGAVTGVFSLATQLLQKGPVDWGLVASHTLGAAALAWIPIVGPAAGAMIADHLYRKHKKKR
jgi:fructose-specific phosphotransferase system IIC component